MVPYLFRGTLVLTLLLLCAAAYRLYEDWPVEPRVQAVKGTVERRIHLSIKGEWDGDKRRKFICQEEP